MTGNYVSPKSSAFLKDSSLQCMSKCWNSFKIRYDTIKPRKLKLHEANCKNLQTVFLLLDCLQYSRQRCCCISTDYVTCSWVLSQATKINVCIYTHTHWHRDSSVSTVTLLRTGQSVLNSQQGKKIFLFSKTSWPVLGATASYGTGNRSYVSGDEEATVWSWPHPSRNAKVKNVQL